MAEAPSDDLSPLLSTAVQLPRASTLLSIDQVAALIASQLALPEGNRRSHWRAALLAAWPALAAREQAAMSEQEPERRRRLEALARELDAMTEVEAGAEVRAEFERRVRSDHIGAWSWRVFDAIKAGRLQARLRDGVRVPSPSSTSTGHAPGWVSAGDLADWLEREGFEVTHDSSPSKLARSGEAALPASPAAAPASVTHRASSGRQGDAISALIVQVKKTAPDPLNWKSVWSELSRLAETSRPAPLLGVDEDGIKFSDNRKPNGIAYLTREKLRDRLRSKRRK